VFASGSSDDLVRVLSQALADPKAERAAAEDLRADVLTRYDWDRATKMTEAVYVRCL
jgi:glycosyltransferase involved in cell wall biosynthesis